MRMILNWIEPNVKVTESEKKFSNKKLWDLIAPLFVEQFLVMLIGIADTLMVSYAGEAAVSGVSLVNMFITIFIYIFVALASGAAVVISQYVGKGDKELSDIAASQILTLSSLISFVALAFVLIFNHQILGLLFGTVDPSVMEASVTYLSITTFSFPALAIYNSSAAMFRSMGKTKKTMHVSLIMNLVNVIGNYIGIFILHAGVAGVAWPSFISRVLAAVIMVVWAFNPDQSVTLRIKHIFSWHADMMKRILNIAIPNSVEQGLFQISKVALSTITALFGTSQIAANGVAQSFWSMSALIGVALNPAFITVIGQSLGAKSIEAAKYYMLKLLRITYISSVVWNVLILVATPFVLNLYDLSAETKNLIIILVLIHNSFNALVFPVSSPFSSGIRAAGDVKFAMKVSMFATVVVRVVLSYIFAIVFNLGVIGIALAMGVDWTTRAIFMAYRFRSEKWLQFQVI